MSPLWFAVRDGDPLAFALYRRHYSYRAYADGRRERADYPNRYLIAGPGEKLVLMTADGDALFVWRRYRSNWARQHIGGDERIVECAVFRNEGKILSSLLIREAMNIAGVRWPGQNLYTFVNPKRVRSVNPGYCFLCAGWQRLTVTAKGLIVFEYRAEMLDNL